MGQKVNPHGIRVGVLKTGIPDGMQKLILQTTWLKTIILESSLRTN